MPENTEPVEPVVQPDPRAEDLLSAEEIAKAKAAGFSPVVILGDTPKVEYVPTSEGVQLAQGKSLEEVLELPKGGKVTVYEVVPGKWIGEADGVRFEFSLQEILAAKTPGDCIKAKYLAAK